ncbi:MAG TPA: peptide-methionine (S)-S-oxide reductase MsrA [Burkholderiaceae bacterium]|nr:peptide-methionine (S)-S-oxide reductase MsrA [Burkholderiaceae bacterium]
MNRQVAVLGGGCFWCVEAVFNDLKGVLKAESGYAGGHVVNPTYEQVCDGRTGHAEVVRVEFDADELSFRDVLGVFFSIHDPTTQDRQGNDVGPQYRSAIFHTSDEQAREAREFIAALTREKVFRDPIVTEVTPLSNYSTAEAYHQRYFEQHPGQGYCAVVIAPKMAKFRKQYASRLKAGG